MSMLQCKIEVEAHFKEFEIGENAMFGYRTINSHPTIFFVTNWILGLCWEAKIGILQVRPR